MQLHIYGAERLIDLDELQYCLASAGFKASCLPLPLCEPFAIGALLGAYLMILHNVELSFIQCGLTIAHNPELSTVQFGSPVRDTDAPGKIASNSSITSRDT